MPNPFAVEGAFLTGAYAALQDYSQLCRFDYAWTPEKVRSEESHLCFFDIANDPLRMLSERAGALFFLRRDVSVSESAYPFYLDPDALTRVLFLAEIFHDCAFLICSAMKPDSSSMPSFVRLLTLKSGAPGLTVS